MDFFAFLRYLLICLPAAVLLFWAARRRNRSLHWVWWALTTFGGWIALIVLLTKKPKIFRARYDSRNLVCTTCGATITIVHQRVQQSSAVANILYGVPF